MNDFLADILIHMWAGTLSTTNTEDFYTNED